MCADDDLIEVFELDNPYPLGVPERVMKQWMCRHSDEPYVMFTLDICCMTGADYFLGTDRLSRLLRSRGADPAHVVAMLTFIDEAMDNHEAKPFRSVLIGYSPARGWCVKLVE